MSWEHRIAKELKKRDNPKFKDYVIGTVISPTIEFDAETGDINSINGDLVISCYDGQIRYSSSNLQKLTSCGLLYKGQRVLLLGDDRPLILGVISNAF